VAATAPQTAPLSVRVRSMLMLKLRQL
jgi:hypothetical protein